MGEPLERHFASLDRITKLERDLAEAERQRDEARNDAAALGEEASRAWAVLVGRGQDWQAGRVLGSCVTEAERVVRERDDYTERYKVAMANGLRAIAERDEARRAALRWEGNADAAERETATHRRAAEVCIAELDEAQQSLRERAAEREALAERVSVLEEQDARLEAARALPVLRTCGECGHAPSRYARPRVCQHPALFDREDPVLLTVEHADAPPVGCPLRGAR